MGLVYLWRVIVRVAVMGLSHFNFVESVLIELFVCFGDWALGDCFFWRVGVMRLGFCGE